MGFTKLFSSLVHSTVWREEMHVKVVWVTMLALANRHGDVLASVPGLADASRVSLEQCVEALKRLSEPDAWSRTKEHEGRRIVEVDGGWRLLNYEKYREIRDADERRIQTREAVRRHRSKKAKPLTVSTVSQPKPEKAQAEAEAEADSEAETTTTKSKSLVALTRDGIVAELGSIFHKANGHGVSREAKAALIFAYWAAKWNHPNALFDSKRKAILQKALRENADAVSELLWVVDGAKRDDWAERPKFSGIEYLFKDRGTIERLSVMAPGGKAGQIHPMAEKYCGPAPA